MNPKTDLAKRTLTIERSFQAPIALVWEAWTKAEHIANWWGPKGMDVQVIEHDFQVGGRWKYVMQMPDGNEFSSEGVYSEIIEHEFIATSADFKPMTVGVEMHMQFTAVGDTTHFALSVIHPTEEYCRQQADMGFMNGWGSAFDRLAAHLQNT